MFDIRKNFEEKLCGFLDLFPPLKVGAFIERKGFIRDVIKSVVMDLSRGNLSKRYPPK